MPPLDWSRVVFTEHMPEAAAVEGQCQVVLDFGPPERVCYEITVLRSLKADPITSSIPVVMVSMLDDRDIGHALGAADYLTKPFDREKLVQALRRFRQGSSPRPVLVVEDDKATRDVVRRALERDGWIVFEADNGRSALESLKHLAPDLIVLDLMMPQMDGFEFMAELRRTEPGRRIPVVVVTAKEITQLSKGRTL